MEGSDALGDFLDHSSPVESTELARRVRHPVRWAGGTGHHLIFLPALLFAIAAGEYLVTPLLIASAAAIAGAVVLPHLDVDLDRAGLAGQLLAGAALGVVALIWIAIAVIALANLAIVVMIVVFWACVMIALIALAVAMLVGLVTG